MNSYPYIVEPIYNYRRFRREGKRQIKKNTGGRAENGHYKLGRTETVTRRISQQKKNGYWRWLGGRIPKKVQARTSIRWKKNGRKLEMNWKR